MPSTTKCQNEDVTIEPIFSSNHELAESLLGPRVAVAATQYVTNKPIFTGAVEKTAVFHRVIREEPLANPAFLAAR